MSNSEIPGNIFNAPAPVEKTERVKLMDLPMAQMVDLYLSRKAEIENLKQQIERLRGDAQAERVTASNNLRDALTAKRAAENKTERTQNELELAANMIKDLTIEAATSRGMAMGMEISLRHMTGSKIQPEPKAEPKTEPKPPETEPKSGFKVMSFDDFMGQMISGTCNDPDCPGCKVKRDSRD